MNYEIKKVEDLSQKEREEIATLLNNGMAAAAGYCCWPITEEED